MNERKAYASDLTDKEWKILEPLIPAISAEATHVEYTRREIVNGILYVLRSGCPWRLVPHDLPAWGTLSDYFRTWRIDGTWDRVQKALLKREREKKERDEEPSGAVIDSQSIKTSAVRGEEKGIDMGKKIWGRKRHLLVDTQGGLMEVKVTGANVSDLAGAKEMLEGLGQQFPRMQRLWGDSHYGGSLISWIKEHLGWEVEVVRSLGTALESKTQAGEAEETSSLAGFQVLPRRWVVERSIAWICRWRRLCRDHEGLPESSEAFIKLSASRRMLSLLASPAA